MLRDNITFICLCIMIILFQTYKSCAVMHWDIEEGRVITIGNSYYQCKPVHFERLK